MIGTFNVESPEPHAFTDADLQFLQIFCRDVAMSLNTLQLLAAQRMNAAQMELFKEHGVTIPVAQREIRVEMAPTSPVATRD